jgi:bifunctional non-homologous end joining protein LigD
MLPYLKDRPVILVRYPDGITGKSFFQRDAPGFVPKWIRTEKLYSDESHRDIAYLIIESEDALAYIANLGTIPIHMWSSRIPHLERPDWLLFDIDPKGTTTEKAVKVALETIKMLRKLGLRPVVKTSGQAGIHVVVGLEPRYTYEHARGFAELVAQLVVSRVPKLATVRRDVSSREGRVYIDYLQLGYGKTIVATFAVRPIDGAPVSAPIRSSALTVGMQPGRYNIKTMARYMARMRRDPFIGALRDQQTLEQALPALERELKGGKLFE